MSCKKGKFLYSLFILLTQWHEFPTTLTHTQPKKVTLTPTHPHPAKKWPYSPISTHTQPKATLSQKMVTLTHTWPHPAPTHTQSKKGHTHPHITERKNVKFLKHYILEKYSLFIILAGVFIFEKDYVYEYFE